VTASSDDHAAARTYWLALAFFLPAGKILCQIVFSVWINFGERKWVISA
jgi:hypothetical protein